MSTTALQRPARSRKSPPPAEKGPLTGNLHTEPRGSKMPFQVRIPAEVRRDFKSHAVNRDMDYNDLFVEVWQFWKEHNS